MAGTENAEAELMKFSISRSNDVARFLNESALFFINLRSASAESRTSLHPRERNENAFAELTGSGAAVARVSVLMFIILN